MRSLRREPALSVLLESSVKFRWLNTASTSKSSSSPFFLSGVPTEIFKSDNA
jgi:hypothetical protein